jgi:formylglycine-generating enzyme required for sulfatase activity
VQDALLDLNLTPANASVVEGLPFHVDAIPVTGGAGVNVSYEFSSSDPSFATVARATGDITTIAPGNVTISVIATGSGSGYTTATKSASMSLTVTPATLGVGFGLEQFAAIPAGAFVRGSTSGDADEVPLKSIAIAAFRMQKTEVTQGQWRQVMAGTSLANPSWFSACGDTCPVESVLWTDAQSFVARLNALDPGKGYRLPTEAEWEYAARAGTYRDNAPEGSGWINENSANRTHPVANLSPNDWRLFDMAGNVWEWVNDWYDASYYSYGSTENPQGPPAGAYRIVRGGAFNVSAVYARPSDRVSTPSIRNLNIGFRLARNP